MAKTIIYALAILMLIAAGSTGIVLAKQYQFSQATSSIASDSSTPLKIPCPCQQAGLDCNCAANGQPCSCGQNGATCGCGSGQCHQATPTP